MARPNDLLQNLVDNAQKPHKLVNIAGRFSIPYIMGNNIEPISDKPTWPNHHIQTIQRIGRQRVAQIDSFVDDAYIQYELNMYQGNHGRVEKVAGAEFYMENVPAGAVVGVWVIPGYDTSSRNPIVELISAPIKEGLNRLTFDEVECSLFELNFDGLAGQTQYLRYAVPLGYADGIDDVQYNPVTPTINSGTAPIPMGEVRSFTFPDEQYYWSNISGARYLRNPQEGNYTVLDQNACKFVMYAGTGNHKDERMVCGIKLHTYTGLKTRLTIAARSYGGWSAAILAEGIEFLEDVVLWFTPTPAYELEFLFEIDDPLPENPLHRTLDFLETYCIYTPGETEAPLTPVSIEPMKWPVPITNPSTTSALNIKPVGKIGGVSAVNVALASAGSTATADAGTEGGRPAMQVIDGDTTSDWTTWGPPPCWLEIDFNALRYITRIVAYYKYMPADWVIEGQDETGVWITIATESRPVGYLGAVTYDFSPVALTKIRYRGGLTQNLHAIYEIEAYEVNMVDMPLPVALMPVNRAVVTDTVTNAALNTTISSTSPNWKLVFLGLKFSSTAIKDYTISIKHVPTSTEYNIIQQVGSSKTDELITAPLNMTSDFELHVTTSVLGVGETVKLVAITEDNP
ncbi:MAG: hypothetical protein IBX39_09110 [Candidatus Methanoperedenaceae archaeon]|nr:hypothetical protein [Candidatus Methanoperedenaceae archaeon]